MPEAFSGSFQDFLTTKTDARFTDWLAARAGPYWSAPQVMPSPRPSATTACRMTPMPGI
jgi:hypothetical protein